MGGPSDLNEGALVVLEIAAKDNSSGYYDVNFGWMAPEFENCATGFPLIVGSNTTMPFPLYGGCIVEVTVPNSTIGNNLNSSNTFPQGTVFTEIVGASNGTGTSH